MLTVKTITPHPEGLQYMTPGACAFDFRSLIDVTIEPGEYKLIDTFGCTERPSVSCPTFLERKVHTQFLNAVQSYNIIDFRHQRV